MALTQTLRPNSLGYTSGSVSIIGGAGSVQAALSDSADATRVKGNNDLAYVILGLTDPVTVLTSTQRLSGWRFGVRLMRTVADQHRQYIRMRIRDTDNAASEEETYGVTTSGGTLTQYVSATRTKGPNSRVLTAAKLASLRLDVVWNTRIGGATGWPEVGDVWVEIDYRNQPVVSSVDIAPLTTTSRPVASWTSTLDGVSQAQYRVRVFKTSDTVVGGFDPATAASAYWDSGIRAGSAQDLTLEKDLLNGVSYTAYVAASQAWAGPEGPYWWSTYVASPSRTLTLSPPAAVTAAMTVISTLPDYRVMHTITAGSPGGGSSNTIELDVLEKCFRNRGKYYNWVHPQLSSGGGLTLGTDGWYSRQAATFASLPLDTAHPAGPEVSGARMISWNPSVGPFSALDIGVLDITALVDSPPYLWPSIGGLPMRASIYARTRSGTFSTRLHHVSFDTNGTILAFGDQQGSVIGLNTSWQRIELAFTPPAGSLWGRVTMENVTPSTGVETLWTGLQVGPDPGAGALLQGGIGRYLAFPPDTSWIPVRNREVLTGVASGGKVYVIDNEIIGGRPLVYRARSVTTVSGQPVAGPWTYYNNYISQPSQTLLRDPFQAENTMVVKRDGRSAEATDDDVSVFHAEGRDGDPISLRGWRSGYNGSLSIAWETPAELRRLRDLVRSERPVLIQWHDGGATYAQIGNGTYDYRASDWGIFSADYLEKERP